MKKKKRIKSKTLLNAIIFFLIIQLIPLFALWIIPVEPEIYNSSEYYFAMLLFIVFTTLSFVFMYTLTYRTIKLRNRNFDEYNQFSIKQLNFNSKLIFITSILGLLLMLYDRIYVRGINYSLGLRNARYQWLYSEVSSSIWSKIGNLLVPFGYVGLWFLLVHKNKLKTIQKFQLGIAAVCTVLGHAALNGGRSQVLLGAVLWIAIKMIMIFRNDCNKVKEKILEKAKKNMILIFAGLFVVLLTLDGIGKDMDLKSYIINFAPTLLGSVNLDKVNILSFLGAFGYMMTFITMYLLHGQYSFRYVFSLNDTEGYAFFGTLLNPFIQILKTLGFSLNSIQKDFFTTEYAIFLSLPGAFFYDFGYVGLIVLSLLLGIVFAIAILTIKFSKIITGYKLAFIMFVLFYIILSPVMSASGFAYFYFIIYAFITIETINRFKYRKKINWM
ncbi:MAG: oligosaccharide repeat unit polymerase [Peptostreptococcaceae bacterium]|nr:oligosaccharide repeat unit polymerase [Peptostreptococcaceae bacterium]